MRYPEYYEAVREALLPEYRHVSEEQIGEFLDSLFEGMTDEELEAYGEFIKKLGKGLSKILPKVAPIAGAALGSVIAPGIGTVLGGSLGGMLGKVAGGKKVNLGTVTRSVGSAVTRGLAGKARAIGGIVGQVAPQPAARQLMTLLNNPRLHQAVLGQVMGPAGRNSISVTVNGKPKNIPFGAFMNALSQLSTQAAIEAAESTAEEIPTYLMNDEGHYLCDTASPEQRASTLLQLLSEEYNEALDAGIDGESDYDSLTEWFIEARMVR